MTENKGKRLLLTLLTTGVATLLAFGINFCITPFITSRLGSDAYGFINLSNTFVSYALIGTTAITSFATRYIGIEYLQGNYERSSRYFSTVLISTGVFSVILFVVLVAVGLNLDHFMNVPERILPDVQYLMILVFVNFLVVNASTCFSCSAYIENKLSVYGLFQSASYIIESALLLVLYGFFAPKLAYFGMGLLAAGLVVMAGNLYIFKRYTPMLKFRFKYFKFGYLKNLLANGVWNSVNQLGNTLNSGLDLVVVNLMLNPIAMGQVAISKTFSGVFSRLFQLVSTAFQPLFLDSYSKKDADRLHSDLFLSMKLAGTISNILFAGFFALCPLFYRLWIPGQDLTVLYPLTILTVACSAFEGPINPLYYVYTLTVKNKVPCFVTLIGGVVNVAGMVLLIAFTDLGIYAVALTTTVVMGFINLVTNPIYIAHCLGQRPTFFYPTLGRVFLSCGVMCPLFTLIANAFPSESWISFISSALVCALAGCFVHFAIAFSRDEKRVIMRHFARKA